MALADDLLEQANHLATREKKKPRQASLRRAVSTAYYAIFHLLVSEAVSNWRNANQRADLGRAFEHGRMRVASARLVNMTFAGSPAKAIDDLRRVANAFVYLQRDRHDADYDGSLQLTRTQVLAKIALVERAFSSWRAVRNEDIAQDYLLSLLVKDR